MSEAREIARGKWGAILGQWLDDRALAGKHTKCPVCGGKDRFRLDDKEGCGTWICSVCGAGDGFGLLQHINGWSFAEAARHVEDVCGRIKAAPPKAERCQESIRASLRKVWAGSAKVTESDPVGLYLARRTGSAAAPSCLRYHPELPYRHDDGTTTHHPAMLAQVLGGDGGPLSIHRTYLTADGQKASVGSAKKLMTPVQKMGNAAVRLSPATDWLGVAEGIETAMCASIIHKLPVWSCISAGLLKAFRPPEGVQMLVIFGDHDSGFTGQAAAYELARQVTAIGVECRVLIPDAPGDWADVHRPSRVETSSDTPKGDE